MNTFFTNQTSFPTESYFIAPCGINCGICKMHLRESKPCPGCNGEDTNKPKHCVNCSIRNCTNHKGNGLQFCFTCEKFPCRRIQQLDKRYRLKYKVSLVENLQKVQSIGSDNFIKEELLTWTCPSCNGLISVHTGICVNCGLAKQYDIK